jgi:acetyl-CoA carboxylase biotin carboxyl carrier protein
LIYLCDGDRVGRARRLSGTGPETAILVELREHAEVDPRGVLRTYLETTNGDAIDPALGALDQAALVQVTQCPCDTVGHYRHLAAGQHLLPVSGRKLEAIRERSSNGFGAVRIPILEHDEQGSHQRLEVRHGHWWNISTELPYKARSTTSRSLPPDAGITLRVPQTARKKEEQLPDVEAHITGTVWKVECQIGQEVEEGDTVVVIESMKMEMPVEAEDDGTVKQIACKEGQSVSEGDTLVVLE